MSDQEKSTEEAPAKTPQEEPEPETKGTKCPQSPTGNHDPFHNEGTDETYCRYCGKTE